MGPLGCLGSWTHFGGFIGRHLAKSKPDSIPINQKSLFTVYIHILTPFNFSSTCNNNYIFRPELTPTPKTKLRSAFIFKLVIIINIKNMARKGEIGR